MFRKSWRFIRNKTADKVDEANGRIISESAGRRFWGEEGMSAACIKKPAVQESAAGEQEPVPGRRGQLN